MTINRDGVNQTVTNECKKDGDYATDSEILVFDTPAGEYTVSVKTRPKDTISDWVLEQRLFPFADEVWFAT